MSEKFVRVCGVCGTWHSYYIAKEAQFTKRPSAQQTVSFESVGSGGQSKGVRVRAEAAVASPWHLITHAVQ
jgi:hypothetical protein